MSEVPPSPAIATAFTFLSARSPFLAIAFNAASTPEATAAAFERLRAAKVVTALRGDRVRVSPHVYNGPEDVDRCLAALGGEAR